ncbi:MAG: GAF domain-containing protein [Caldilineales bacterium]
MSKGANTLPAGEGARRRRTHLSQVDLAALTEAGLAIVRSQLDVDGLCELVYQQVVRIVDADHFHLGLFEGDSFNLRVWVQDGRRLPVTAFPGAQDAGIIGWLRATQRPLLVRDFSVEMPELPARPSYDSDDPPRSAIFVPLVAGDEVVGSMSVQHHRPDVFDEDDLRTLDIIGHHAASAVVNARLFQTIQRRAEQLAAVAEVSQALIAELDFDQLLTKVVELIRGRFGYYHAQIFLVEDETHRAVFRASSGHRLNQIWLQQGRAQHFGEGIIGWVAASGKPLLVADVAQEPRYIPDDPRLLPDTRSELAVPLVVEGEVLGVLDVQSREQGGLGEEDLFVLTTLANQVAVAVDSTWSYWAKQEEAWITTVLLQMAEAANQAENLDEVVGAVTRITTMLVGAVSCSVWLRAQESDLFELADAVGLDEALPAATRLSPGTASALAQMLVRPAPISLVRDGPGVLPEDLWRALAGDEVLLLPLLTQNRLIGCLLVSLDNERVPVRLHDKRMGMLAGIAQQVAASVESVRQASYRDEEAWISWALLEVSQAISNAQTVDEMLESVVRLTPLLAGVDRCAALLVDEDSGDLVVSRSYAGRGDSSQRLFGLRLAPGDVPLLDLVRATQTIHYVADAGDSDLVPPLWRDAVGSKSLAAAPLTVQDEVLGILLVDAVDEPHRDISQRRRDIMAGIARQASLSLENFRLQVQEQQRIRLLQELEVAHRIQTSLLPDEVPDVAGYQLAHEWEAAREVGGDFYDFIPLPGDKLGIVMADVADKGVPAALFMARTSTLLRLSAQDYASPDRALVHANRWLNASNREDMFVTVWYGMLDPAAHVIQYANAGHGLALHVSAADGAVQPLRTRGIALGIVDDPTIEIGTVALEPGDMVVLYTDGVVDILDEDGEEYGQDRLSDLLVANRHLAAQDVADALVKAVWAHAGSAAAVDDVTLVVLKRRRVSEGSNSFQGGTGGDPVGDGPRAVSLIT